MSASDRRFWVTVGIATAVVLGLMFTLQAFGLDEAHGAELCAQRDYADLDPATLPCLVHVEFDGAGHALVTGTNPGPGSFLAATFHIPDPDNWQDNQTQTDSVILDPGDFDIVLNCAPGAAQVDVWLAGQDQPYAAATTTECGSQVAAPAPTTSPVVVPVRGDDTPPSLGTASPEATAAPVAVEAGVGGGQGPATDLTAELAPAPTINPQPVGVLAATANRGELPTTGAGAAIGIATLIGVGLLVIGAALIKAARS